MEELDLNDLDALKNSIEARRSEMHQEWQDVVKNENDTSQIWWKFEKEAKSLRKLSRIENQLRENLNVKQI